MHHFNNRPACLSFLTELCGNCTKLGIDSYPQGLVRGQYLPRWHSIPFPANYHHSASVTAPPWRLSSPQLPDPMRSRPHSQISHYPFGEPPRRFAVSFMGTTSSSLEKSRYHLLISMSLCHTDSQSDTALIALYSSALTDGLADCACRKVREELRRQCVLAGPSLCHWEGLSSHGSSASQETHGGDDGVPVGEQSTFCLTPPGDFPTRKGIGRRVIVIVIVAVI